MLHLLRRHPFPVVARFRHCLVLTYAYPEAVLAPLLPPGLTLDTYDGLGFLAIALVQTEGLRPAMVPEALGQDFFLSGYRLFARFRTPDGRSRRGLRILRSDTDRRLMVLSGNLLTHYNYRKAEVGMKAGEDTLEVRIRTPHAEADLHVVADLSRTMDAPPPGSPFPDLATARRFAGPLPYTFDYEAETHSIVMIHAPRRDWRPRAVAVDVKECTFLAQPALAGATPILANAFHLTGIPYRWERGSRELLAAAS